MHCEYRSLRGVWFHIFLVTVGFVVGIGGFVTGRYLYGIVFSLMFLYEAIMIVTKGKETQVIKVIKWPMAIGLTIVAYKGMQKLPLELSIIFTVVSIVAVGLQGWLCKGLDKQFSINTA